MNKYLFRSPLKQGTASFISFIEIVGISNIQFAQEKHQPTFNAFGKQKMIMILHQTPCVQVDYSLFTAVGKIWIS